MRSERGSSLEGHMFTYAEGVQTDIREAATAMVQEGKTELSYAPSEEPLLLLTTTPESLELVMGRMDIDGTIVSYGVPRKG